MPQPLDCETPDSEAARKRRRLMIMVTGAVALGSATGLMHRLL
jgi:hypothetical protein